MPYRFSLNGLDVQCDTLEELHAASKLPTFGPASPSPSGETKVRRNAEVLQKQGSGPRKSWVAAEAYAKKHGITRNEARSILAAEKKKRIEQALSKVKV